MYSSFRRTLSLTVFLPVVSYSQIASKTPLEPVAAREQGEPLFYRMPEVQTGIDFTNEFSDPRMWGDRFLEFSLGALGTGVAVGDFDLDGLPDIYAASKTESNRLYRNLGGWKFEDVTELAGVGGSTQGWCQGVAFVDYDNDGWLDLYECRFDGANRLYRNNGDGTFTNKAIRAGVNVRDASGMASFADYDRDGFLDFYLQTNLLSLRESPTGQADYLFRNSGDGTFEDVTERSGISGLGQGHSATWIDYNQDGFEDIYVANDFTPADKMYHNAGDGRFIDVLSYVVPHTPNSSMGADIADINNDGFIDFMVGDMATTSHEKDMRGMVDGREETQDPRENPFAAQQYPRNAVYLNSGIGPFYEAAFLTGLDATDWTWSLRFEDFDNDGWSDLHVTTGMIRELHGTDLMGRVRRARSPMQRVAIVKASSPLIEENLVYRNVGGLRFEEVSEKWGLDELGISFGAATGDFDGDGDLDLVYSNYQKGLSLMRNDSREGNRLVFELEGKESNRYGIGSTVEIETDSGIQKKVLSLSRGYLSTSEPIVHFGLGKDNVAKRVRIKWTNGSEQVFENLEAGYRYRIEEDLDSSTPAKKSVFDRKVNYVEVSRELGLLHRVRDTVINERIHQPLLPMRNNRVGPALALADVDGDGQSELFVGGTREDPSAVFQIEQSGRFQKTNALESNPTDVSDGPALFFDADGDGDLDLLRTAAGVAQPLGAGAYRVQILANDGKGGFSESPALTISDFETNAGAAATADIDNDGDLDIFIGGAAFPGDYPRSTPSAVFLNTGGKFEAASFTGMPEIQKSGLVRSALFTDVNQDGWVDLLLAAEWSEVKCWLNLGNGKGFEDAGERLGFTSAGSGWWNSIESGDFNEDGRLDYVVGNVGLNTKYKASEAKPTLLYSGQLDGDDLLIEAQYEGGRLVPLRGYHTLSAVSQTIKNRFSGNEAYSTATLDEIVGSEFLEESQVWKATNLANGLFLSNGEGGFKFAPLPRFAQVAPVLGLGTGDFDGDGHCDLYVLQNSYAPIPSVGRFDGGLSQMLLGKGNGEFEPLLPVESGLLVTGEAKALLVHDINGDRAPDFLLSRNNSSVLVYENRTQFDGKNVAVNLKGSKGNLTGIGSRVELILSDGSRLVSEVYGGNGYLSQGDGTLYFHLPGDIEISSVEISWPKFGVVSYPGPFEESPLNLEIPSGE